MRADLIPYHAQRWGILLLPLIVFALAQSLGCDGNRREPVARPDHDAPRTDSRPWTDVNGAPHHPLDTADRPATVLLFLATECPISNAYAPEIKRIAQTYAPRGVAFFAVHGDATVSATVARRHADEFGYPFPVLLDPRHELVDRTGAIVTPEAAVLDSAGQVAYLGRIDDLFTGYGKRRHAPTTHELRDALDAMLGGQDVARPRVPGWGCEIPGPAVPQAG